jgi:hypothetical protein
MKDNRIPLRASEIKMSNWKDQGQSGRYTKQRRERMDTDTRRVLKERTGKKEEEMSVDDDGGDEYPVG